MWLTEPYLLFIYIPSLRIDFITISCIEFYSVTWMSHVWGLFIIINKNCWYNARRMVMFIKRLRSHSFTAALCRDVHEKPILLVLSCIRREEDRFVVEYRWHPPAINNGVSLQFCYRWDENNKSRWDIWVNFIRSSTKKEYRIKKSSLMEIFCF